VICTIVIYNCEFVGYDKTILIGVPHLSTVCQLTDFLYLLYLVISFFFTSVLIIFLVFSDNRKLETYVEVYDGMIFL